MTLFHKSTTYWFIAILPVLFGLNACKKSEETSAGSLYFHLHTNIDTSEIEDYGLIYPDGNGHRMYLSLAQLYLSGIQAVKADGSSIPVSNAVVLKVRDKEQYLIGQIPAGKYTSVAFQVGLDATTNQTDPASYASSNPLSIQDSSMWFGSVAQGYVFVNVKGGVDTTSSQNAPVNQFQSFSFQLGTSAELQKVSMPSEAFAVAPNQSQEVHITIDFAKLLKGLNLKTEHTATPFSNPALAAKVATQIPLMFRYEM